MVILTKVRASTLVETLVASVIIVVSFIIASLCLNNIFKGAVSTNKTTINNRIKELTYFSFYKKLDFPYNESNDKWEITAEKNGDQIVFIVLNKSTSKEKTIQVNNEFP